MLKAADAKEDAKKVGVQAIIDDVYIGGNEDEYPIKSPSQRTIFGSIKTTRPMDKITSRTLGFLKRSKTMDPSKGSKEGKTPLDTMGNDFMKPRFYSIPLPSLFPTDVDSHQTIWGWFGGLVAL